MRSRKDSPDDLLRRIDRVIEAGLSNHDVEWRSGVALGFLREARQGARRGPRNDESWRKLRLFLEAWEPLLGPARSPRRRKNKPAANRRSPADRAPGRKAGSRRKVEETSAPELSIRSAFDGFLAEQRANGASARVLDQHATVFRLMEGHLDRYADEKDDAAAAAVGAFAERHGPDRLLDEYYMFFSYYLPRKVVCSKATIRATGSTGAKLARWLGSKGLVDESAAEDAVDAARHLTRELLDELADEQEPEGSWAW